MTSSTAPRLRDAFRPIPHRMPLRRRGATSVARCWSVLFLVLIASASAQEEPSRLRYTVPEGWTRGADGRTLLPPGGNAAVTFAPSTAFTGTAEQWSAHCWNNLSRGLKVLSGPASNSHNPFLVQVGLVQQPDGANVWISLHTLVQDGRAESLIYFANGDAPFRSHMPALIRMLNGISVTSPPAAKTPSPIPLAAPATSPTAAIPKTSGALTLGDYDFIPPERWHVQNKSDHFLLTQTPDASGCVIQLLPPQSSSAEPVTDAQSAFATMYSGWQYQKNDERRYILTKGFLPRGLEYGMMEASMSRTNPDGRYELEDGAALVVKAGSQIAIIAVRHRGLLAHNDCERKYETWRRFFNSFTIRNAPVAGNRESDPAHRIIGAWSQTESGASSEYVFAANGHYAFNGAVGSSSSSRDTRYEYLHIRTYAFEGDGTYSVSGDMLTLRKHRQDPEQARFRFEQVNHGGTGWKDRLYLLRRDRFGENEVRYEKPVR